jgi:hypothetical protein
MKEFAFKTHVMCYSQDAASVCRLPSADWSKIIHIIDTPDLFDSYGAKQMLAIVSVCFSQKYNDVSDDVKAQWQEAKQKLQGLL